MERANFDGIELDYEITGSGVAAIFIHGALIADAFRPLLTEPALSRHYRLITYFRRGHGNSTRTTGPVSIAKQAADTRALLKRPGIDRAHVVGHSYGGAVALELALANPVTVTSLALLEPAVTVGSSLPVYREALARGADRYREVGAEIFIDEFLSARWPGYRPVLDRVLPNGFAQAVSDAETWFASDMPGLIDWQFGELKAQRVSQPTLLLMGSESTALSPRFEETHHALLKWIPQATGVVIPGATHLMQFDDPQAVAAALAAFWTNNRKIDRAS